jgi:hypothetical protein
MVDQAMVNFIGLMLAQKELIAAVQHLKETSCTVALTYTERAYNQVTAELAEYTVSKVTG